VTMKSFMPEYIHHRNIQGFDRGDPYSFRFEKVYTNQNSLMLCYRNGMCQ